MDAPLFISFYETADAVSDTSDQSTFKVARNSSCFPVKCLKVQRFGLGDNNTMFA